MPPATTRQRARILSLLIALAACGSVRADRGASVRAPDQEAAASLVPLSDERSRVAALRAVVGERRIVLLGENGHGVGPHTALKGDLTRLLLDSLGFSVVVFESGYHECAEADRTLADAIAAATLRDCLAYAFEQAEALPTFEHIRQARRDGRELHIAGADLQPQGTASLTRPHRLRQSIAPHDSVLADIVARADSGLLVASQYGGDSLRSWLRLHGAAARRALERGLALSPPATRWHLRASLGLLRRGELRFASGTIDGAVPAEYYAERDRFLARTVSWIADSSGGPKRVVVWMHNDHVRRGRLSSPAGPIAASGGLLAVQYPRDVVSIGFFMGPGEVANNSRVVSAVQPIVDGSLEEVLGRRHVDVAWLPIRGAGGAGVRRWAAAPQRYLRNGVAVDTLVPADEFDALVFTARAAPPSYRLPQR
jgi:erythromycin esterase